MVAMFEERASTQPTLLAGVCFWRAILADLVRSAARERLPQEGRLVMHENWYDVRQAWRTIAGAPVLALFILALMALNLGSTTAAFSVVHAVLIRPFPFAEPERLVMIRERRGVENVRNPVGAHEFPEWKARSRSFAEMAAIAFDRDYNLTGVGEPTKLVAARVTAGFFAVMGVAPIAGRTFVADEDRPGQGDVVVISEQLWRSRFAGDAQVPGRTIELNGVAHTVVGVMPAAFQFPSGPGGAAPDIWTPVAEPIQLYRGRHYLSVVARLAPGVTIAQAQADMDAIATRLEQELPQFSRGHGASVQPLHAELVQRFRRALLLVFAGVALVLLIGCCNVASLLLARAAGRQQEIALRIALGAGRLRVARQLLAEGGLLAALGGAMGLAVASWLIAFARAAAPHDLPRLQSASLDGTAVLFAAALTTVTALVFGLVPLRQNMRVEIAGTLKSGSKGIARPLRQPLRRALVVAEVALTLVIATGASLFLQSLQRLMRVDPGFRMEGIIAADVALPATRYQGASAQRAFLDEALSRLGAQPGVTSVAATSVLPHGGGRSGVAVSIEGRPSPAPGEQLAAGYRVVSAHYFRTLDMPILSGRTFTAQDARDAVPLIRWFPQQPLPPRFADPQALPVAVINESMARQFWPGTDPIGRRFTVLFSPLITVVGVVRDSRNHALQDAPGPEFYLSDAQEPQAKMTFLVRAPQNMDAAAAAMRAQIWTIDPELPVSNARTLASVVDGNLSLYRSLTSLMGGFAGIALLLMSLGVYALVSYTTTQRTFEIGVRLALGAQPRDIRRLVVTSGAGLAATGIVAGLGGAYALARFASNMLYEVRPSDPFTYAALAALILGITVLAAWLPARRAQRVNPITVLRAE